MEKYTIDVELRDGKGSSAANKLRKEGYIPAIAYHKGESSVAIKVPTNAFTKIAAVSRKAQVFTLRSPSKNLDGKASIIKNIQRDYVNNRLIHIDFQTLKDDEAIHIDVPVKVIGEAPGVKVDGGVLTIMTHEIAITCLPKFIPSEIQVDVSALQLNESIHAKDLKLSEGVVLNMDDDETIISVTVPRAVEEAAPVAAEGAAAEGAAAAAPAAGEKAADAKAAPAKK